MHVRCLSVSNLKLMLVLTAQTLCVLNFCCFLFIFYLLPNLVHPLLWKIQDSLFFFLLKSFLCSERELYIYFYTVFCFSSHCSLNFHSPSFPRSHFQSSSLCFEGRHHFLSAENISAVEVRLNEGKSVTGSAGKTDIKSIFLLGWT